MTERYYKLGYLNIIIIKNDTGIAHNDNTIGRSITKQFMFKRCSLVSSWNIIQPHSFKTSVNFVNN